MKKQFLWLFVLAVTVSVILTLSFVGCKGAEEVAEEAPAEEEVAEEAPAEEEVAEEAPAEEEAPVEEEVAEEAATKSLKIGYVSMMMAADSNARAYDAFEKAAGANGWEVFLTDAAGDIVKVAEGVQNYVGQGVDVIVVTCGEIEPIKDGLAAAKEAGIPVFCMDTGIDEEGAVVVNVTSNCWAMGAEVGAQMVNRLNRKGNVCIINMPTLYVHRYRNDTAQAVFNSDDNPDIHILATEAVTVADWDTSYDIMSAWITQYGNEIDAVFGTWDGISWGVSDAIEDAGFTKEDMFTMSIDGTDKAYDIMRRGGPFVGVVAQDFGGWATTTADIIDKVVVQGLSKDDVVPESRVIYIPYKWIDSTNVPPEGASPESVFE